MAIYSKLLEGLTNDVTYYAKVFPVNHKGRINNRVDLPFASVMPSEFPLEPTSYNLIGTYTTSTTFVAPEDGHYQIELFGEGGAGGTAARTLMGYNGGIYAAGGGGGGGGYAMSRVAMRKGDTCIVGITENISATVTFNSSLDSYSVMNTIAGKTGGNAIASVLQYSYDISPGIGGDAGTASGGNIANINGGDGGTGEYCEEPGLLSKANYAGGTGGASGHADGNTGGTGGALSAGQIVAPGSAAPAFVKIYRGDTNRVSA